VAALLDKRHSSQGSGTTFLQVSRIPLWFLDSTATGIYEIPRTDAISLRISEGYQSTISDYLILFLPTYSLAIHHLWH